MSSRKDILRWNDADPYAADVAKIARRNRYNDRKFRQKVDKSEVYQ